MRPSSKRSTVDQQQLVELITTGNSATRPGSSDPAIHRECSPMTDIKLDEQTEPADEPNGPDRGRHSGRRRHRRAHAHLPAAGARRRHGSLPASSARRAVGLLLAVHPSFGSLGNFANLTSRRLVDLHRDGWSLC